MSTPIVQSILKTPLRKLVYPVLWLSLVLWFLSVTQYRHPRFSSVFYFDGTSRSNSSRSRLADYYDVLTHSSSKPQVKEIANQYVTANVSTSNKASVIIETRRSGAIVPLILHFSAVLGPDWPIIIYTSAENFGSFSTSQALHRHQRSGRVVIRPLADGVYFPSWESVSNFLTTPWLWEDLAPAEHILMFQTDSILCANAVRSVEDFFQYDLIGAPIAENLGVGFNGGLSLRKRSTILRVLNEFSHAENPNPGPEDQWFFARMRDLEDGDIINGIEDGIKLPAMEIARTFAVETIDFPHPLGLHQPTRFIAEHMLSLDEWCPEYKLATTDRISS